MHPVPVTHSRLPGRPDDDEQLIGRKKSRSSSHTSWRRLNTLFILELHHQPRGAICIGNAHTHTPVRSSIRLYMYASDARSIGGRKILIPRPLLRVAPNAPQYPIQHTFAPSRARRSRPVIPIPISFTRSTITNNTLLLNPTLDATLLIIAFYCAIKIFPLGLHFFPEPMVPSRFGMAYLVCRDPLEHVRRVCTRKR